MRSRASWFVALLALTTLVLIAGTASAQINFDDESGNGHHLVEVGSLTEVTEAPWATGITDGSSQDFAKNETVQQFGFDDSSFTIFLAANFTEQDENVFRINQSADDYMEFSALTGTSTSDGIVRLRIEGSSDNGWVDTISDNEFGAQINTDELNTVGIVVENSDTIRWFINGTLQREASINGQLDSQNARDLWIPGGVSNQELFDLRFWTTPLSNQTMEELHNLNGSAEGNETAFYPFEDPDGDDGDGGDGGAPQTGAGRNQVHLEPDYGRVLEANETLQVRAWGAGGNGSFASHIGNQTPRVGIYATANADGTSSQQDTHLACWDSTNRTWVQHNDTGPLAPSACQHALFDTVDGAQSMGVVNLTGPHVPVLDGDEHPGVTFWIEGWVFNSSLLDANVTAAASSPAIIEGSQAQASTLSNTAFHDFSGLTSLEWALFFGVVFLGVILWARAQDLIVEVLGAMLPVLAGLLLLGFGTSEGFGSIWVGVPAMSAIFMLAGIYMIMRVFLDKLGREEDEGGLRG